MNMNIKDIMSEYTKYFIDISDKCNINKKSAKYEFDSEGKLNTLSFINNSDKNEYAIRYAYNIEGLLAEERLQITKRNTPIQTSNLKLRFANIKNIYSVKYVYSKNSMRIIKSGYTITKRGVNYDNGISSDTVKYDDCGRKVYTSNNIEGECYYRYDKDNNISSTYIIDVNNRWSLKIFRYDAHKRLIYEGYINEEFVKKFKMHHTFIEYDDHGVCRRKYTVKEYPTPTIPNNEKYLKYWITTFEQVDISLFKSYPIIEDIYYYTDNR